MKDDKAVVPVQANKEETQSKEQINPISATGNPFSVTNANPVNNVSTDAGRQQIIGPSETRDMGQIGTYEEGN